MEQTICNACGLYEDHDTDVTNCPAFSYENGVLFGILTLGQLRNFTKHLPDTTQIIISDINRTLLNVDLVLLPDNKETFAITLLPADTFDPRQF